MQQLQQIAIMLVKVIILAVVYTALCAINGANADRHPEVCYNSMEPPLDHLHLGCLSYSHIFHLSKFPKPTPLDLLSPKFIIHSSANSFEVTMDATQKLDASSNLPIRPGSKVVILAHGALSDHSHRFVSETKRDLLALEDPKLVVVSVSWPKGSGKEHYSSHGFEGGRLSQIRRSASNSRLIGSLTAEFVKFLKQDERYAPANIHCIGFSVGAHLCGFAGKRYQELTNGADKFDRITGLDPATPVFNHTKSSKEHLWHTDAKLVDVMHTNTLLLGMSARLGHIDFYLGDGEAKYGQGQPGCLAGLLSKGIHNVRRFVGREVASDELAEGGLEANQDGSSRLRTEIGSRDEEEEQQQEQEQEQQTEQGSSSSLRERVESVRNFVKDKRNHRYVHCSHQRAWQYFGNGIRRDCRYTTRLSDGRSVEMGYFMSFDPKAEQEDEREIVRIAISKEPPHCQKRMEA